MTRWRDAACAASLLFAAAGLPACGAGPAPNILLISLDTARSDHLSAYGYASDTTPALRRFAEQGARIELAYAPTATTGPSHATLFTSLYPLSHGVVKNGLVLEPQHRTLAEILAGAGYQTAAIVGSFALDSRFGFAQGFERYDDAFESGEGKKPAGERWEGLRLAKSFDRRADATTRRALRWLAQERNPSRPFFLFVHYFEPHAPYLPPEALGLRFAPAGAHATGLERTLGHYDAELAFTDAEVGALLEALDASGLAPHTLVTVAGDHGEGLYDHGHMEHGAQIYEEAVRVPLLFRWPGHIPPGRVVSGPVSLLDVLPTLLDLAGIEADRGALHGRSFAAALTGGAPLDPGREIFLHRRRYDAGQRFGAIQPRGEQFGVRAGRWKYIEGEAEGVRELFDLEADPGETRNLVDAHPETAARLAERVRQWRREHEAETAPAEIHPDDREGLRALGYVDD